MKIGLFFGSFNPIHCGHLLIASQIVEQTPLKQIWFVVSPQNPLKKKETLLDEYQRLHMVYLAIEDDIRFKVSKVEFDMPKPAYTVDTLAYLGEQYPKHQFSLIMGADNLESLPKWKNHEVLLANYPIYVYQRPGAGISSVNPLPPSVQICDFPKMDISASYIRDCVKKGISLKYLVPENVREYIEANFLFKPRRK